MSIADDSLSEPLRKENVINKNQPNGSQHTEGDFRLDHIVITLWGQYRNR